MITFNRSTGLIRDSRLSPLCQAYSGHRDVVNNKLFENERSVGPAVAGTYTIKEIPPELYDKYSHLGIKNAQGVLLVFRLVPDEATRKLILSYGRDPDSFLIHWDTAQHNFAASDGCIILYWQWVFELILKNVRAGDNTLIVA